jgi:hypothetical protein
MCLPTEVWHIIFSVLPLTDLKALIRVCKFFRVIAIKILCETKIFVCTPSDIQRIHPLLSDLRRVRFERIPRNFLSLPARTFSLSLDSCEDTLDVVNHYSHLRTLEIIHTPVVPMDISRILHIKKLVYKNRNNVVEHSDIDMKKIFSSFSSTSLEYLSIESRGLTLPSDFENNFPKLKKLKLRHVVVDGIFRVPSTIKKVDVQDVAGIRWRYDVCHPNLKSMRIYSFSPNYTYCNICRSCPSLRRLVVSSSEKILTMSRKRPRDIS